MSKHRVLCFKPCLRLEWRGQDGQNEPEQPDHSASLDDSITASTRMRLSVHTTVWEPRSPVGGSRIDRPFPKISNSQTCALPPSANSSIPVTKLESSEPRKSATLAISSGSAMRPIGTVDTIRPKASAGMACVYRKPKLGRSGDGVRQGWRVN
jgi:hypothetical protein